ncbi:Agglutinin receptor [Spatholobus suberectus]|nr:Agglutinin receptor [Spatholobus suberectus]
MITLIDQVTKMRLKVDLQCPKCYKKVKKILCKFPQIRDQVYDEKNNIVTIKVVCCNPEKLRDKLCYKGCGAIKSIEIVEPPKPEPEPEKKKERPKKQEDPQEPDKPTEPTQKHEDPQDPDKPNEPEKSPRLPAPLKPEPPPPVLVCPPHPGPPPMAVPIGVCCVPCYEGRPGGPCFHGYGGPPPCYGAYYGRPIYDSYGGGRPCHVSRCDEYISEENTSACTIM